MSTRLLLLLGLLALPITLSAQTLEGYHTYDALTRQVNSLVTSHSGLASAESIGTTLEGREVWLVTIANRQGTPLSERPAVLVAANLEGNQLVGSELSLEAMRYLLESYDTDAEVKARLDETVFYFMPRVNPDGAERAFAAVQTGSPFNTSDYDDDNDARMNEDGPEDLNGDGLITVMRVADPKGDYMIDPDEPRLMKKADASEGESGTHSIYWEGRDSDGDGFYNDDGPGGVDMNRNFQHEYPYYAAGAGIHMVSERESRAVLDFVIANRNVAMMLVYGASDNLVTAPNDKGELGEAKGLDLWSFADASIAGARDVGVFETQTRGFGQFGGFRQQGNQGGSSGGGGTRPATTVSRDDVAYYKSVSEEYREVTGLDAVPPIRKPEGALFQYGYFQYGVPSFSTPGWAPSVAADSSETEVEGAAAATGGRGGGGRSAGAPGGSGSSAGGDSADAALLKWMDANEIDGFAAWSAYDHPELGAVEIGGFKPYQSLNPPAAMIAEMGPKQGGFIAHLATLYADVQIAETEVISEGGGIFRVKAQIENAGFLPTSSAQGVRSRSVRPTMVQLDIEPEALLSGSAKTSFFQATDGSGKRQSFEWIIKGTRGQSVELRVVSQKGGSDTRTLRLQ
ncbi:MAG: hypothetical protein ACI9W4_001828 [Rhodothermales bacterium]|jgi:hypothetical protein